MKKLCKMCNIEKPIEEMCQNKGQVMYCLVCRKEYNRRKYKENRETILRRAKDKYAKDKNRPYKICSRCKSSKPVNEYHKDIKMADNLSTRCKECIHEIYLNKKNPDYVKKNMDRDNVVNCSTCGIKFDDVNKCWAKGMCKKCYYRMLYATKPKRKYDKGRWSRRIEIEDQFELEKLRIENLGRLKWFIDEVNRKIGYIDMVDSFIMCDLYEIYNNGNKYELDALPVEKQLRNMWEFLSKL